MHEIQSGTLFHPVFGPSDAPPPELQLLAGVHTGRRDLPPLLDAGGLPHRDAALDVDLRLRDIDPALFPSCRFRMSSQPSAHLLTDWMKGSAETDWLSQQDTIGT